MSQFADMPLTEIVDRVAEARPTPGAGPTLAWTCALAAALAEMVTAVTLPKEPDRQDVLRARQERASALRRQALSLAEADAEAYERVLAVQRRPRDDPGRGEELRRVLAEAADPLVAIAEAAGDVAELAAEALADARGGVRGEAMAAIALSAAVTRACGPVVELNLAGRPDDPRRGRVRTVVRAADEILQERLPVGGE